MKNIIKDIYHWHGDHTAEYMKEELNIDYGCDIYKAIQLHKHGEVTDKELLEVTEEKDAELLERYGFHFKEEK